MESARNGMQEKFQVQNILYTTCVKLSEICRDIKLMLQFSDSYCFHCACLTKARSARILSSVFKGLGGFVYCSLYSNYIYITDSKQWNSSFLNGKAPGNIVRWYSFIKSLGHVEAFLASIPDEAKPKLDVDDKVVRGSVRKEEGKFVELPGAEVGNVVVRFPPEASG